MKLIGNVKLTLRGPSLEEAKLGRVKEIREVKNLVVDTGESWIANKMAGGALAAMSQMAVGTGVTAPAGGDTQLGNEIYRKGFEAGFPTHTDPNNNVHFRTIYTAGDFSNTQVSEAGILNAGAGGTMLSRSTFTAINKGTLDTLQVDWTVTITGA